MDELYRFVECVDDDCEKDELHEFLLVERCEHGNIDVHKYRLICYHVTEKVCRESDRCWCEGAGLEDSDA